MITESQRTRVFWAINLYHCVNDAIVYLLPTVMATFYQIFGLNLLETSIIFATNLGMIILMQLINGYLADKHMEKALYFVGIICTGISTILLMLAHDYRSLLSYALINGFGLGFVHALVYTLGARLYPDTRETKLAIQGSMGDLGKLISIISSAIILLFYPSAWRIPFLIWGSLIFIVFFYALFVIPKFPFQELSSPIIPIQNSWNNPSSIQKSSDTQEKQKEKPKKDQHVLLMLLILFICYSGAQEIILKSITLFLTITRQGLSNEYAEILFAIFMAAGTFGSYSSGRLKTRFGIRKFLSVIFLNMIIALSIYAFVSIDNIFFDLFFVIFIGFNVLSVYITVQSEITFYVNFKRLGLGYGLLLGIGWFGSFLAWLIVGPIANQYGPQVYYYIAAILSIFTLIILQFIPVRSR